MKSAAALLLSCLLFAVPAQAQTVRMDAFPDTSLAAGQNVRVVMTLSRIGNNRPISLGDLKTVHTKKIHLLVIDPTLTDYSHIHPTEGDQPGKYVFEFTPQTDLPYRMWADITLVDGGHEYVMANMGGPLAHLPEINKETVQKVVRGGFEYTLSFPGPVVAGAAIMGTVKVKKSGQPFKELQPVLGAFAHVVGFSENYTSVLHAHPMGAEQQSDDERAGPEITFHLEPQVPGFVKLFVQLRIDDMDVFVPFGITVK